MNEAQEKVEEFMRAFGQSIPPHPTLEGYPQELRMKLILEEALEFVTAAGASALVTTTHNTYFEGRDAPDMVEMIDAMCDILYVTYGAASAMGIDLEPFFNEVHRSNMAKLGPDGKPIRREDGKVMKPKGWTPPDLVSLLTKELTEAEHDRLIDEADK